MSVHDDRWTHGMDGWRVLAFDRGAPIGYGEVTGYDHSKHSFYVVLDDDPAGESWYLSWEDVRPA